MTFITNKGKMRTIKTTVVRAVLATITVALLLFPLGTGCAVPSSIPDQVDESADNQPASPNSDHPLPVPETTPSSVRIIIYTDLECGACEKLHTEIEPVLRDRYVATDKAEIDIRLLGAISIDSMRAAQATLCAADQGYFLEYQDALYHAWRQEEDITVFSSEALIMLAGSLGLDKATFINCLNSESKKAEVEENMVTARADGVRTLPAFLVGTSKIEGYNPLDIYINAVEKALATQSP